jgi:hypothetical protein
MIIAALMTLLIWLVIRLLSAVIKADRTSQEDVDLGLFAYAATKPQAVSNKPNESRIRA